MMLRRLAIAALLALAPSLAMAESPRAVIAATPPTADNGDRIATTAWVNNFVNAGLPLASGKIWIGSAGNIATAQTPSGDLTMSNAGVFTFGTVNANVGSFGSATQCATITVNAKGLITAASAATCTPAVGSITGLGAGVATALAVATGTNAGSFITYNGPAGTPSAIVLTAGTGLPISTGVSGLGAGCATFLGTPSSANLRGCLTDEVGTGAAYFVGGALGTPASGTATNLTGLPVSTGLTGAGTGVLTALANAANAANGFTTLSQASTASPGNPTGTTSATPVMMGAGSSCTITPRSTGRVMFIFNGSVTNTGSGNVITMNIRYGTGAAPANGAAGTGTAILNSPTAHAPGASFNLPLNLVGFGTGLAVGAAAWFDLTLAATAGTSSYSNLTCMAIEF